MLYILVFYLQGDGVQSEVPHISDGVIQGLFDALQLRGIFLQKLAVVLQLDLCVYFYSVKGQIKGRSHIEYYTDVYCSGSGSSLDFINCLFPTLLDYKPSKYSTSNFPPVVTLLCKFILLFRSIINNKTCVVQS